MLFAAEAAVAAAAEGAVGRERSPVDVAVNREGEGGRERLQSFLGAFSVRFGGMRVGACGLDRWRQKIEWNSGCKSSLASSVRSLGEQDCGKSGTCRLVLGPWLAGWCLERSEVVYTEARWRRTCRSGGTIDGSAPGGIEP